MTVISSDKSSTSIGFIAITVLLVIGHVKFAS